MHRLQPRQSTGYASETGTSRGIERPAGVGAGSKPQLSAIDAPEPHPFVDEGTETFEYEVEPPYRRRSIMQMEFPRSLNCTVSTSLRMRKRPRPVATSSCSG
jgi:hypothetical protein